MARKELIYSLSAMFIALLLIQVGYGQREAHDIASVRAEQKIGNDQILAEIRANNKAAIERSQASAERFNKLGGSMNQLIGIVDTLTKELVESGRK